MRNRQRSISGPVRKKGPHSPLVKHPTDHVLQALRSELRWENADEQGAARDISGQGKAMLVLLAHIIIYRNSEIQ
jgi:hypothetical protein